MAKKQYLDLAGLTTYDEEIKAHIDEVASGKANSSHKHAASDINSGTLSSDRLPTVPIAKGGTGATTAAAALTNLGITATAAELNKLDGVTATATELNYVDGVTSNIQTQLDSLSSDLDDHTHSGSDITSGTVAAARLPLASSSAAGIVDTSTQTFAGAKTFTSSVTVAGLKTPTANTGDIGSSSLPFDTVFAKDLCIAPQVVSGSAIQAGRFTIEKAGTTTTDGLARLEIGNYIQSGKAGNAEGYLEIYNASNGSVTLRTSHEDDNNFYIELPEHSGTLLTDDDLAGYSKTGHSHSAANITSGTLAVERGGTGNMEGYVRAGAVSGSTIGALATAEGRNTTASGSYSHAEGNYSEATGSSSHAEGQNTTASNTAAHAEGENTTASGAYSHAEGENTIASAKHQHVQGKFNKEDSAGTYAHIVGNGTGASTSSRSNAHTLDWNGNAWFAGDVYVGGISQSDSDASKLITEDDCEWTLIHDSGAITSRVNSISNINVSGYKKFMIVVKCVNSANSTARAGSVIFKATDGTSYQFPVWTNLFTTSAATAGGMAEFEIINNYLICPYATRNIKTSNFMTSTEGGTADNLTSTGGGILKCTKAISSLSVSSLDQDSNFYFENGSRVYVWGCNA